MQSTSKTIWVQPGELVFNQVLPMQSYTQSLQLQNTLSAPVELTLKSSNQERLDIDLKQLKLAPREVCQVEVTFKQQKAFPSKSTKLTETLFIKSDFFDQKVNVIIYPSHQPSSPKQELFILQNTGAAFGQKQVQQHIVSRQQRKTDQKTNENRELMELAGESFGRGSQSHAISSPQQYLRPDLTGGTNEEDTRGLGSDFERDSTSAIETHKNNMTNKNQLQELKARLSELTNENIQLKQLLMDSKNEISESKQQMDESQLSKIKAILREREPKLEDLLIEAMKHERLSQDKKDKKILEILQFKDQQIEELSIRLKDSDDKLALLKQQHDQKQRETQQILDKLSEKIQLFENEEKFQELLMSQDTIYQQKQSIQELETELNICKSQMQETENKQLYFEDAFKRCKPQLEEKEKLISDLKESNVKEKQKGETFQFTVDELRIKLNKANESILQGKENEISILNKERQTALLLQQTETEKEEFSQHIIQLRGFISHVHSILGRVTGEDGSQTGPDSRSSISRKSDNQQSLFEIENKLEQRAEEIVQIVEQVQNQYTALEQEMRTIIDLKSDKSSTIQPALKQSKHFESKISDKMIKSTDSKMQYNEDVWTQKDSQNQREDYAQHKDTLNENSSSKLLTQKITELKGREKQLLEQLSYMKDQLKFQTSQSNSEIITIDQAQFAQDHNIQRISELEILIFQQREQILNQQDEISNLRQRVEDKEFDMKNQIELLTLRNRNLLELNKKYEFQGSQNDMFGTGTLNITSPTMKSTAVDTERMKQYAQQLELVNMDLKHKLEETKVGKVQAIKQIETMKAKTRMLDHELASLQQELVMRKVGLNSADSKLAILVQELRSKVKLLESQRNSGLQSEVTTNYYNSGRQNPVSGIESASSLLAVNQLQGSTFFALKEEFCTKLEKLAEQNNTIQRNSNLQEFLGQGMVGKCNTCQTLNDKEMKWFGQVEELKQLLQLEKETNQTRLKDLEKVLNQKNSIIFDNEREVKKKDKMLSERQEQLSILLSAMEQQANQPDDPQQKLANVAAELCSMKAVEAQMERKVNDLVHQEKQATIQATKLQSELQECQHQINKLQRQNQTIESSNELLERQKYDLNNQFEEIKRDQSTNKYNQERLQFQIKIKEETIDQLKSQLKASELYFKEQIDRIREETLNTWSSKSRHQNQENSIRPRYDIALKHSIQNLHLVITDFIERQQDDSNNQERSRTEVAQQKIIVEMEKSIQVAQGTINKLEGELDKEKFKITQLENEWDTQVLNNILVMRHERLTAQIRNLNNLIENRETERAIFTKCQAESHLRLIQELELKVDGQQKHIQQADDEITQQNQKLNKLMMEKEELQSSVMCFQQELANQKASLELKAQITVDERFKSKNDNIKSYFENQISKILMGQPGSGDSQKLVALSNEICAFQLLNDKQRKQIEQLTAAMQSADINMRFYRDKLSDQENKTREVTNSLVQEQNKQNSLRVSLKIELDKKKQENLALEKDFIRTREDGEHKSRENVALVQRVESQKAGDMYEREMKYLRQRVDGTFNEGSDYERQSKKIQQLQEQLMDVRGSNIQELEDLKLQYDLELAEAKRELSLKKFELERKFMPGTAPGEILDQNTELRQLNQQLYEDLENISREKECMRQQLDELLYQVEYSREDTHGYRQALQELEQALLQGQVTSTLALSKGIEKSKSKKSQKTIEPIPTLEISQLKTGEKFVQNPPILIKELIKAKGAEHIARMKLREHLVIEGKLRHQLTLRLQQELSLNGPEQTEELLSQLLQQNQNVLNILNANAFDAGIINSDNIDNNGETCPDDMTMLVKTIISLIEQISSNSKEIQINNPKYMLERVPLTHVVEAQRIVIRALSAKQDGQQIQYVPEREIDKKIWYLELLEQQVSDAEKQATNLKEFVKRLQIGVTGNLQSAAEIKATSMDLAQNLKAASDEIKSLRHITGLIKHDVLSHQNHEVDVNKASLNPINPFIDAETTRTLNSQRIQDTHRSNFDKLMNENESMQNQLSLTSKIKQSIEQELINTKLQHATELQNLISKFSRAERQLNLTLDANHQLKLQLDKVEQASSSKDNQVQQLEKLVQQKEILVEKQKTDVVKSKDTSKHLQRLQSDMQEWRKQSETNLKLKTEQLKTAQDQIATLSFEKEKLKVEVSMLRKSQKAIREGHELNSLEEKNKELAQKLEDQFDERKQEIDFWVAERAQMRAKIEELESKQFSLRDDKNQQSDLKELNTNLQKVTKKAKSKDYELKALQSEFIQVKDNYAKVQLDMEALQQKLRDESQKTSDLEDRLRLIQKRSKEVEIEKDLLVAESRKKIQQNDNDTTKVGFEIDNLRSEFAKLKFEKNNLVDQIERQNRKELEFNQTIERLTQKIQTLENSYISKNNNSENQSKILEQKNNAFIADLKYLRIENEKLQSKVKDSQQQVLESDAQLGQLTQEMQSQVNLIEDAKRRILDAEAVLKTKSLRITDLESELIQNESKNFIKIKSLQENLTQLKDEAMQAQSIFTAQINSLKSKLQEKNKNSNQNKEIELGLLVSQKETVAKHLKKEASQLKSQITKLKQKNLALKDQIESINQKPTQPIEVRPKKGQLVQVDKASSLFETQLIEKLTNDGGLQKMLKQLQNFNRLEAKMTESEQNIAKLENWNSILTQQIEELQGQQEDKDEMITELKHQQKEIKKDKLSSQAANEKMLREQLKLVIKELEQTKNEWLSPQAVKEQVELIAILQQQLKQLQNELNRKGKLVTQLKSQKEAQEEETNQFLSNMNEMKDDFTKQQKIIKEFHKRDNQTKDLRSQIEWLQKQEKTAREEVLSLNDKLRHTKSDLVRKDQIVKEYKDKLEFLQNDIKETRELKDEIDKLKDMQRKQKLDLEIKENQIRVLKQRIDSNQEELQGFSQVKEGMRSYESQIDTKIKAQKNKTKRYQGLLRRAVAALKRVGSELLQAKHASSERKYQASIESSSKKRAQASQQEEPLKFGELQKDAAYYKDSVEILGLGFNELETFINPQKGIQLYEPSLKNNKSTSRLLALSKLLLIDQNMHSCLTNTDKLSANVLSKDETTSVFLERLERLEHLLESHNNTGSEMQEEIEHVQELCVKMIQEIKQ